MLNKREIDDIDSLSEIERVFCADWATAVDDDGQYVIPAGMAFLGPLYLGPRGEWREIWILSAPALAALRSL